MFFLRLRPRRVLACTFLLGAAGLSACSTEPETPLGSGVDPEKPLSETTDNEHVDVCDAANEYSLERTTKDENCLYQAYGWLRRQDDRQAWSTEELRAECRGQLDLCISAESGQFVQNACWATADCTVRVGEFEECLIALSDSFDEGVAELASCGDLTHELLAEAEPLFLGPAFETEACAALPEECGWSFEPTDEGDEGVAGAGGAGDE